MSASEEANDHANILPEARRLRLGTWIEKILRQARKSLTGMGVADTKDLTEKQINALPNLTGQASYPGWIKPIVKSAAPQGPAPDCLPGPAPPILFSSSSSSCSSCSSCSSR